MIPRPATRHNLPSWKSAPSRSPHPVVDVREGLPRRSLKKQNPRGFLRKTWKVAPSVPVCWRRVTTSIGRIFGRWHHGDGAFAAIRMRHPGYFRRHTTFASRAVHCTTGRLARLSQREARRQLSETPRLPLHIQLRGIAELEGARGYSRRQRHAAFTSLHSGWRLGAKGRRLTRIANRNSTHPSSYPAERLVQGTNLGGCGIQPSPEIAEIFPFS